MKIKTSELTGAALDWAVAKCEEVEVELSELYPPDAPKQVYMVVMVTDFEDESPEYNPSTDWQLAGPIIEREGIELERAERWQSRKLWIAQCGTAARIIGPTPLIAAMRCYCASKLGDEVEITEELK